MNNIIISSLALFFVFVTFSPGSVFSVSIHLNPNSTKITCMADKLVPQARTIISIKLYNPDGSGIAFIDQSSKVTIDKDPHLFITETEGKIEKNVEKSQLTVTMSDILISQSGIYTCKIYYKTMKGNDHHQSAKDLLNITKQETHPLLDTLRYKVWTLKRVSSRVGKLEGLAVKQNTAITAIKQQATYMSAFSAGYEYYGSDLIVTNEVLVFRIVHMKVGDGYDETKGIFTAPVDGYYVFHLTVFYEDTGHDDLGVNIVANGVTVAQAYVDDPKDMTQSSVSTVVQLEAGQEVKSVVSHFLGETNKLNVGSRRSGFTGYLIKAL